MHTFIPRSLVPRLRDACPEFAAEVPQDQLGIARLMWRINDGRRAHHRHAGAAFVSKQDLRECFVGGDQRIRDGLFAGKHFLIQSGDFFGEYTSSYQPTAPLLAGMSACVLDTAADELVDFRGEPVARQRGVISPYRKNSKTLTKWTGVHLAREVEVDLAAATQLLPLASDLAKADISTMTKLARCHGREGVLRERYTECETGRLFAGQHSLQNCSRTVRAALLNGSWDYDIANCHFAVFLHLAGALRETCPAVSAYIQNKRQWRQALAQDVGITEAEAKTCLLMVLYGAPGRLYRPSKVDSNDRVPLAYCKLLGDQKAERLFAHELFQAIDSEVRVVGAKIVTAHTRGRFVVNAIGSGQQVASSQAQALAHVLQGVEAAALRAVARLLGSRITVLIHDGWVSPNRVDVRECERAILDATGVPLRVEERQLIKPEVHGPELKVSEAGFFLEDQGLTSVQAWTSAHRSRLAPCCSLELARPAPSFYLPGAGVRPAYNYFPRRSVSSLGEFEELAWP